MSYLFTSESVSAGHPDKLCDQISDGVLDALIAKDPDSHVACEVATTTGLVLIFGEITTNAWADVREIAREVIRSVGYDKPEYGFDADSVAILQTLKEQSSEIKAGVDDALETRSTAASADKDTGAGDQGIIFGYAVNETPELMPLPITLAHKLCQRASAARSDIAYLRPDGKSQVTVEYDDNGRPIKVHTVLVSWQHDPGVEQAQIKRDLIEQVIKPTLGEWWHDDILIYVTPSGSFVTGGPVGDAGLTGRKIIVDTYGGAAHHGGGAFSGKDPTKVDRSAAYAARYVAKNLVAAGIADKLELQVAYAIGKAEPLSLHVDAFGTGKLPDAEILKLVRDHFDLRPRAIIETLGLRRPLYRQVAAYGHFGRADLDLPWEKTDLAAKLKAAARL